MGAFVNLCQKAILLLKREQKKKKNTEEIKGAGKTRKEEGQACGAMKHVFY